MKKDELKLHPLFQDYLCVCISFITDKWKETIQELYKEMGDKFPLPVESYALEKTTGRQEKYKESFLYVQYKEKDFLRVTPSEFSYQSPVRFFGNPQTGAIPFGQDELREFFSPHISTPYRFGNEWWTRTKQRLLDFWKWLEEVFPDYYNKVSLEVENQAIKKLHTKLTTDKRRDAKSEYYLYSDLYNAAEDICTYIITRTLLQYKIIKKNIRIPYKELSYFWSETGLGAYLSKTITARDVDKTGKHLFESLQAAFPDQQELQEIILESQNETAKALLATFGGQKILGLTDESQFVREVTKKVMKKSDAPPRV